MFTTDGPTASASWLKLAGTIGGSTEVAHAAGPPYWTVPGPKEPTNAAAATAARKIHRPRKPFPEIAIGFNPPLALNELNTIGYNNNACSWGCGRPARTKRIVLNIPRMATQCSEASAFIPEKIYSLSAFSI
jgi:hypothetical protein